MADAQPLQAIQKIDKSTNMNNEKWNEICFLLSENVKKDISESSFEQNVIQALRVLDWKQFSGDFEIRPSYQIGAVNRITPDFVIKSSDNHKLFVIEVKQPNIPLTSTFQQQLFSYMRQLKLEYGILIGQAIQIFYDGSLVQQEDPVLLDTIRFERNSEKGENFVKLFSKESFNLDLLNEFTLQSLKKINRRQDFKFLLNKISSEDFKKNVFNLIKQEFISEYDGELIDSVLNELNIEITISTEFTDTKIIAKNTHIDKNKKLSENNSGDILILAKLKTYPDLIIRYYNLIDTHLRSLGHIEIKERETMVTFYHESVKKGNAIVWIEPRYKTLKVHLSKNVNYPDNLKRIIPGGWDYPEIIFKIDELEKNFEYIKKLLSISYRNVCDK